MLPSMPRHLQQEEEEYDGGQYNGCQCSRYINRRASLLSSLGLRNPHAPDKPFANKIRESLHGPLPPCDARTVNK
jgi:hypothetical protein